MVHVLLQSSFLSLVNFWNLMASRASTTELERRVAPFLKWLKAQITLQEAAFDALISVNLSDATLLE